MSATIRAALLSALAIAGLASGIAAPHSGSDDDLVFRRIWTSSTGSYSLGLGPPANGRLLSAVDYVSGDVSVYDLASGEYRRLTSTGPNIDSRGFALASVISPDGVRVAYNWFAGTNPDGDLNEIRVIDTDGSNERTLISERGMVYSLAAWADNRTILFRRGAGGRELMLASAVDGATRTLHRFESGQVGNVAASPDGRWIAYTYRPDGGGDADVYALPMTGGKPSALVRGNGNDQLMGWAPDGSGIVFYSNRELTRAIWKLAVRNAGPVGDPELVRADVWDLVPVGFSGNQYFYRVIRESPQIRTATIDAEAGTVVNPPSPIRPPSEGWSREPAWSPDGRYLAFVDYPPGGWGPGVERMNEARFGIRSIHTGETRYEPFPFEAVAQPWWVPDARTLTVFGQHQGRPGIYRYDLQSGRVTRLLDPADGEDGVRPAPDGSRYYFHRQRRELYARDLTTGQETLLARIDGLWRRIGVSPDGGLLVVRAGSGCTQESRLLVLPATGGEPREIYRGMHLGCSDFLDITPDRKYVIAAVFSPNGSGVWRFSMDGGEPVKLLDADPRGFRTSPDGRRVAYWSGPNPVGAQEMWVIDGLAGNGGR